MKKTLAKAVSYIWDIPIEITASPYNPYLEVVWSAGRKMLNTRDANFSFGNGYKVFEKAMGAIESEIARANSVLILGFGCGSILHLLDKEYSDFTGTITGIEYDPEIVRLFHAHFSSNYMEVDVQVQDASTYVKEAVAKYDIVFIDLFMELDNAPLIFEKEFVGGLKRITERGGTLVFNTTKRHPEDNSKLTDLMQMLSNDFEQVNTIDFQDFNYIIIAK